MLIWTTISQRFWLWAAFATAVLYAAAGMAWIAPQMDRPTGRR